jgi:DNA-binding NtrC family response regulator
MTAYGSIGDAVTAMKDSAVDYLTKPFDINHLMTAVGRIDDRRRARDEQARTRAAQNNGAASPRHGGSFGASFAGAVVGRCPAILELADKLDAIADTHAAVLLTGENGTGKELVARTLHERSGRRERPFVMVNCAAVPSSLIEAELFGYERGAAAGAVKRRDGRLKAAEGGTLFLDEVAEIPLETQGRLLDALRDGADLRVVSATNRDLPGLVAEGRFRQDLYDGLKTFELHLPPLRERKGDLALLVERFLRELTPEGEPPGLSSAAWAALGAHPFPGNVRELRHAIQHASILARGEEIQLAHLPPEIAGTGAEANGGGAAHSLVEAMEQYEKEIIMRTIRGTGERRQRAAKLLGISRKSLWKKLTKYGLQTRRANGDSEGGGHEGDGDGNEGDGN